MLQLESNFKISTALPQPPEPSHHCFDMSQHCWAQGRETQIVVEQTVWRRFESQHVQIVIVN